MPLPKVVIVGAGFGGLSCARTLAGKPVEVVLVDRHNYHLFTPLLYQVASSLLNPSDIAYPVRAVFRKTANVRVRVGEVVGADFAAHWVAVREPDGPAVIRLAYDHLVLAVGSTSNFFGNTAVAGAAHGLRDLPEALELRNHVLRCFEAAARESDEAIRRSWLTFAIVGGGPTGVEYAGALSELVRLVLVRDFPELDMGKVRIVLVEARDRILPAFPPPLGEDAELRLRLRGIDVRLNTRVERVAGDVITLSGGELHARTLVWAAGVKPSELVPQLRLPLSRSGRVQVDAHLRVAGQERVYAIGDIAAAPHRDGEMPQLSAPAIQEGRCVARNILRTERKTPLETFRYFDKGIMATIGRNDAVAHLAGGLQLKGLTGWLAWLFVHLVYIIGFRNRIVVLIGWAWNYFRYDRPIRHIERAKEH